MTRRRTLLCSLVGALVLAAGLTVVPLGGPPAGAVGLGWSVTVDAPATAAGPAVTVTGRAGLLLGQVRTVRVRLVPRVELPAACGVPEGTGPVAGGAYSVELRPGCNGPYRAEVVASGTDLLGRSASSGTPAVRDLAVADPGPVPGAPAASAGGDGITVSWGASSDPDVVGWTLLPNAGSPQQLPAGTTRALVPATPGDHGFRLVARRWGSDGPGGPELSSPASGATPVHVASTHLDPPERPGASGGSTALGGGAAGPTSPGGGGASGGADVLAAGASRRPGPLARGGRAGSPSPRTPSRGEAPSPGDPGYGDELPYGDRSGPAADGVDEEAEPAGEQVAAGTPSARVVRSTERTSPGLVVPFTIAFVLGSAGIWLWSRLRRARLAGAAVRSWHG